MAIALRRLGDYGEAQELCQDVFIQAMKKIRQLREPEAFAGWLRAITARMAINRLVRRPVDRALEPEALEATCAETRTPLDDALTGERAREVRRGLKALGRLDRETLVAFYVDGQSLVEMSDRFDSPGRHDQAAAARRPQAARQARRNRRRGVTPTRSVSEGTWSTPSLEWTAPRQAPRLL